MSDRPRIVTIPRVGPTQTAWVAFCPERPSIGQHYAEREADAILQAEAALAAVSTPSAGE